MKKNKGIFILAIIIATMLGFGVIATGILQGTNKKSEDGIILGLDLSGGVSVTYKIVTEKPTQEDIDDTIAKLEERAENYSTEYAVYQVGEDRITVEIPGIFDANAVLEELGSPGSLYFIVQKNKEGKENYSYKTNSDGSEDYELNYKLGELIADGSVILTGDDVKDAEATYIQDAYGGNSPVVRLILSKEATGIFAEATEKAAKAGESIGIYYDDHFISVPRVDEAIKDGNCVISGSGTYAQAEELATFIRIGAISLELEELESNVVGAQLGSQAVSTSIYAAAIGLILIMIFMIAIYRLSGVAASVALAIYTFAVVSFIKWLEITLTLPGIAGIVLGIGMAVDANVIIFARIKEEIATGKSVSKAINAGYQKALSAIIDGNITTFIAAIVLMIMGSGTVKGFAYTLMLSIILSMFTSLVVAKYFMKAMFAIGFKDKKFYGCAKERKAIDFIKYKAYYMALSVVLLLVGVAGAIYYTASTGKAFNYGIEFAGGTSTTADFEKEYTIEEIEKDIIPHISKVTGDSSIWATTVDETTEIVLKTRTLSLEERDELNAVLVKEFGVDEDTISSQSISSTISGEMRKDALMATVIACLFMLLYIRFRFKDFRFAFGAIISLIHDVLIVLSMYVLCRLSVGNTMIACILTILGYSINDTIVIFDRIRENMHGIEKNSKEELTEVCNASLTQTLSRSINTSITTFIMVFLLFILGVPAIKEFALPLIVGLISGSYSSIFIATQLWYIMKTHGKHKIVGR